MTMDDFRETAEWLRNDLRLKTFPVAAKYLKDKREFQGKVRWPSTALGKGLPFVRGLPWPGTTVGRSAWPRRT